jgi:hypothetical protein
MSQNTVNQAWNAKPRLSESFNQERVDAFVLNPHRSHELVQRLSANSAWKITCKSPSLVIFVHSES